MYKFTKNTHNQKNALVLFKETGCFSVHIGGDVRPRIRTPKRTTRDAHVRPRIRTPKRKTLDTHCECVIGDTRKSAQPRTRTEMRRSVSKPTIQRLSFLTLDKTLCRTQFLSDGILARRQCHTAAAEGAKLSTIIPLSERPPF